MLDRANDILVFLQDFGRWMEKLNDALAKSLAGLRGSLQSDTAPMARSAASEIERLWGVAALDSVLRTQVHLSGSYEKIETIAVSSIRRRQIQQVVDVAKAVADAAETAKALNTVTAATLVSEAERTFTQRAQELVTEAEKDSQSFEGVVGVQQQLESEDGPDAVNVQLQTQWKAQIDQGFEKVRSAVIHAVKGVRQELVGHELALADEAAAVQNAQNAAAKGKEKFDNLAKTVLATSRKKIEGIRQSFIAAEKAQEEADKVMNEASTAFEVIMQQTDLDFDIIELETKMVDIDKDVEEARESVGSLWTQTTAGEGGGPDAPENPRVRKIFHAAEDTIVEASEIVKNAKAEYKVATLAKKLKDNLKGLQTELEKLIKPPSSPTSVADVDDDDLSQLADLRRRLSSVIEYVTQISRYVAEVEQIAKDGGKLLESYQNGLPKLEASAWEAGNFRKQQFQDAQKICEDLRTKAQEARTAFIVSRDRVNVLQQEIHDLKVKQHHQAQVDQDNIRQAYEKRLGELLGNAQKIFRNLVVDPSADHVAEEFQHLKNIKRTATDLPREFLQQNVGAEHQLVKKIAAIVESAENFNTYTIEAHAALLQATGAHKYLQKVLTKAKKRATNIRDSKQTDFDADLDLAEKEHQEAEGAVSNAKTAVSQAKSAASDASAVIGGELHINAAVNKFQEEASQHSEEVVRLNIELQTAHQDAQRFVDQIFAAWNAKKAVAAAQPKITILKDEVDTQTAQLKTLSLR